MRKEMDIKEQDTGKNAMIRLLKENSSMSLTTMF